MTEKTDHDLKDKETVLSHGIPYASLPVVAEFFCLEFRETTPLNCNNVFGVVRCEMVWGETPCTDCLSPLGSSYRQECHTACPDHGEILQTHKLNLSQ